MHILHVVLMMLAADSVDGWLLTSTGLNSIISTKLEAHSDLCYSIQCKL
jgi:hypothetical protein